MDEEFFNKWAIITGILQILDLNLNISQTSNDVLMKELQEQDKVMEKQSKELQKQTNMYLKEIIQQNKEILKILKNER